MGVAVVLTVFAFALGAIVGSFLNAVIHRLPRGIRIDNPKRSFCPACKAQIPWYRNLPIVSWLLLRGRCAECGAPISFRYWLVEVLTALYFLGVWLKFGFPLGPVYWVFGALLIAATFIDFEHYIIPDEITLRGAAAGLVLSLAAPQMMGVSTWWLAGALSLMAALLGYGLLWGVVELGKLAFGKKRLVLDAAEPFELRGQPEKPELVIGDEVWPWEEIFSRESDTLIMEVERVEVNGETIEAREVRLRYDRLLLSDRDIPLDKLTSFSGGVRAVVIPREAMGFGDVKFMACIGAFLGWQAVLFTLLASSLIGAVVGVTMQVVTRGKEGGKIPFGPYLAMAAILWVVCGPALVAWYFGIFRPASDLARF
jgi:leader peptidase (prepilin peptidase)/N-methyltransferase